MLWSLATSSDHRGLPTYFGAKEIIIDGLLAAPKRTTSPSRTLCGLRAVYRALKHWRAAHLTVAVTKDEGCTSDYRGLLLLTCWQSPYQHPPPYLRSRTAMLLPNFDHVNISSIDTPYNNNNLSNYIDEHGEIFGQDQYKQLRLSIFLIQISLVAFHSSISNNFLTLEDCPALLCNYTSCKTVSAPEPFLILRANDSSNPKRLIR